MINSTVTSASGIVGYGPYIPIWRLDSRILAEAWSFNRSGRKLPLANKSLPGSDEDVITMSIEAASHAMKHAGIAAHDLGAIRVGTESKPYAVKPCAVTIAEALGTKRLISAADVEFACKAGTEAFRAIFGIVASGLSRYALAIGMDVAQAFPGDELEATAGAGGAAFILGPVEQAIATIEAEVSYVSDTPDFFRRDGQIYPEHGRRFTGAPAYFYHTQEATSALLEKTNLSASDFAFVVFHHPTPAFPRAVGLKLGFKEIQLIPALEVGDAVGNTYAGSWPLGLAATLDIAKPGDLILAVSYGSGAGADAFCLQVTEKIIERREYVVTVQQMLQQSRMITDYSEYHRLMELRR